MKTLEEKAGSILAFVSALGLGLLLAGPVALAENPTDTQKSEIDPRVPEEPAGLSPRGDYEPAQADKGTVEQHAEAIDKEALTPDKPADAGADDPSPQEQQQARADSADAPRAYGANPPADTPQTQSTDRSANATQTQSTDRSANATQTQSADRSADATRTQSAERRTGDTTR